MRSRSGIRRSLAGAQEPNALLALHLRADTQYIEPGEASCGLKCESVLRTNGNADSLLPAPRGEGLGMRGKRRRQRHLQEHPTSAPQVSSSKADRGWGEGWGWRGKGFDYQQPGSTAPPPQ